MRVENPFSDRKILAFPERVAKWLTTGRGWPIVVDLDMTNACNHSCPDCCTAQVDRSLHLSRDEALRVLREFWEGGTLAVSLGGGGDPLCNKWTERIVLTAASWGMSVGVITNLGMKVSGKTLETLRCCCEWVRVSLDAANAEVYRKTHGSKADWLTTLTNIKRLAECPRRSVVGVAYLTGADTVSGMEEATLIARDLGADYIQFRPYNGSLLDCTAEIERLKGKYDSPVFSVQAAWGKYKFMQHPERDYSLCHAMHFTAVVSPDLKVWPCCHLKNRVGPYGDLSKQTVAEFYKSEGFTAMLCLDLSECIPLCRGDGVNRCLQGMLTETPEHAEFL